MMVQNNTTTPGSQSSLIELGDIKKIISFSVGLLPWLIIGALIGFAAGYFYLYITPKKYRITGSILYQPQQSEEEKQAGISSILKFDYSQFYVDVSNQVKTLKSYDLISKTLSMVNYNVEYYIKGRVKTSAVYGGTPFEIDATPKNSNLYNNPIHVRIKTPYTIEISYDVEDEKHIHILKMDTMYSLPDINIKVQNVFISPQNVDYLSDIDYYFILRPSDEVISNIMNNLSVSNVEYSSVIKIEYDDYIQSRGIAFVNALMTNYIEFTIEKVKNKKDKVISYIDTTLTKIETKLQDVYKEREIVMRTLNTVSFKIEQSRYLERYYQMADERKSLVDNLAFLDEVLSYIDNFNPYIEAPQLPIPSWVSPDKFIIESLNNLYAIRQSIINASSQMKTGNPAITNMFSKIDSIKKDVRGYAIALKQTYKKRIAELDSRIKEYQTSLLAEFPLKEQTIAPIELKISILEKLISSLNERKMLMILEKETIIPETKVIEKARFSGVTSPIPSKVYSYTVVGGIVISFSLYVLYFILFRRIKDRETVTQITGVPLLGLIPYQKNINPMEPSWEVQSSAKFILSNISIINNSQTEKMTIYISSIYEGQGKTTIGILLASQYSKIGKKTLLIEFDAYKPEVANYINTNGTTGGLLSLLQLQKEKIIHSIDSFITPINDNLYVLTSGKSPIDPFFLISSDKMSIILNNLKERFDVLIIDSFPYYVPFNYAILKDNIDIVLFVISGKNSTFFNLRQIKRAIQEIRIGKQYGIIINHPRPGLRERLGLKIRDKSYHNHRYYYGYYGAYSGS